jgi:hypothetical protein
VPVPAISGFNTGWKAKPTSCLVWCVWGILHKFLDIETRPSATTSMTSEILHALLFVSALTAFGDPVRFERREIADFPAPYQLAVSDVNGDGKPDVIALSIESNRVDWFENPTWKQHPVARTAKNIDLAPYDIDEDGRPEIALASGFAYSEWRRMTSTGTAVRKSHWRVDLPTASPKRPTRFSG